MSKTSLKTTVEWKDLNWRKLERVVFKLQKRIYRASSRGDVKTVRRLQKTLIKSWAAKALAVRKVSQDNQGKKTAGIDGIKSLTPSQRLKLAKNLRITGKSKPTRRVWIPKPKTKEKRPLGILTMYDRALQSLVKLALEPEWEAKFEPNSYGFRPGRSCHDTIEQLFRELKGCTKYILDADIAKCFDRINHQELLKKLNTYPTLKHQIKAWLKSGVMDNGVFEETETGTPQGGTISPLLANIALHGMEEHISKVAGKPSSRAAQPHLVRYADDLVILHKDINVIYKCQEALTQWLSPMGLELKPSKTRICHSLNEFNGEKAGFDFLGFNIRQYPTGKAKSMKCKGKMLGFTLLIKPSKEKIKLHLMKLKRVIKGHKSAPQVKLIKELNPIIKGWCNYYSTVVSKEIFSYCESKLWQKLRAWAKRRHTKKNVQFRNNKYWKSINGRKCFSTREKNGYTLFNHASTPIKRFVKVQNSRSPYDGDWAYWSSRLGKNPQISQKVAKLLKKQKGKCAYCNNLFSTEDLMEIDHIIPKSKGGKNTLHNLQLLHRHCHDSKTAMDLKVDGCINENDYPIEEPCEVKVSSTVLQTSRSGDASA
jgi:RNA-directed DNA polymerase